jgi:hypothetical protein
MPAAPQLLQLRIELRHVKPKVWRRVLVPASIKLSKLHHVIQAVMGWSDDHLHEFEAGGNRYGPDSDGDAPGEVALETKVTLKQALASGGSLVYTYDFGDDWQHVIKVEKTMTPAPGLKPPICIGGANACPPEDVGGPSGYEDFCRALADETDPDHQDVSDWIGGEWDPAAFDLDAINARLSGIR